MSQEEFFMMCLPVDDPEKDEVISGSTRESCLLCDTKVWVAPSSKRISNVKINFLCVSCAENMEERDVYN